MTSRGSVGVGLLTALENLFPPIPSEVVLPLAGYLAAQGRLSLVLAIIASTLGSLAGAVVLYELAAALGQRRLRAVFTRVPLIDGDDFDRAEGWFERHGGAAVFLGRFIPGIRSIISVPAGASTMSRPRFWLYTTAGSALWNAAFVLAGWTLGRSWQDVGRYSSWINWGALVVLVLVVARYVWSRRHRVAEAVGATWSRPVRRRGRSGGGRGGGG